MFADLHVAALDAFILALPEEGKAIIIGRRRRWEYVRHLENMRTGAYRTMRTGSRTGCLLTGASLCPGRKGRFCEREMQLDAARQRTSHFAPPETKPFGGHKPATLESVRRCLGIKAGKSTLAELKVEIYDAEAPYLVEKSRQDQ